MLSIRGGEQTERLSLRCGQPLRVAFRRDDESAGSCLIVFPGLGRGLTLGPGQEVETLLPADRPAVHEFQSNGGLRGSVEIRPAAREV